jgi:hypothetical protein
LKLTDAQLRVLETLGFGPSLPSNFTGVALQGAFVQHAVARSLIARGYARHRSLAGENRIVITREGRDRCN